MTREFAHEYVHYSSVGDLAKCRETIKNTKERLVQLYNDNNIRGYQLLLIKNQGDVKEKLNENKFEGVTQGKFPFVYSFVQPVENGKADFDKVMKELQYIRKTIS